MSVTIEQWIRRRTRAAVAAGFGEWPDAPKTALGKPIYLIADGPVKLVLSELGFTYDGPPMSFECRYDQVEDVDLAPLRDVMPKEGDLLPRSDLTRLLQMVVTRRDNLQVFEMKFSLRAYNEIASVIPRIVNELA